MRLAFFSVTNYRSIIGTHRIPIGDIAVLLGKNNEGKSNILRALAVSMKMLTDHGTKHRPSRFARPLERDRFVWRRDFPISLQDRRSGLESKFRLEFALDEDEVNEFRNAIKSNLNGTLPIEIKIGKTNEHAIHVPKKGPGGNTLSSKSARIAQYIAEKIEFNYIPAVRTEEHAEEVVQEMLADELAKLETAPSYIAALQAIADLQEPILERIGNSIKESLSEFLPSISKVYVQVPPAARRSALRSQCRVEIDDGTRTLLEFKGDGVKSLAVLGLLRAKRRSMGAASIIAIEEPESHLHPGAIHSLREAILNLVPENQVVLTSHCPLFADRDQIARNILVDTNSAKPAKTIASIRELLGIRASDNLVNASHVLVVEGNEDVIALRALLPTLSDAIGAALKQNFLVIEGLAGAGNLSYKLNMLSNALCSAHVLLDHDAAGRLGYEKAESDGLLKIADLTLVMCRGMQNSELEDCFNVDAYADDVMTRFGVDLRSTSFRGNEKWSTRAKTCFDKAAKPWGDRVKAQLKDTVARAVAKTPSTALNAHKRASIDALVSSLERKLALSSSSK
ncbi:putative ATP-dependent endonuclease of OLD family [Advenella incenata]|uniref:Putative ATP-dependent endonuclease of OLD family n=1 Tax=Advenella incenata TaxID=267800 RepID=A0A4Q7VPS7_9BURK|nr:ATP-binding protein [Advenella incenata]RZT98264.1 putative ATP-dependent endonuclease of OLD family [Advenella incenata]